jgi:cob(I)alamin adenosyltransferase
VAAYGTVDEVNAAIGLARLFAAGDLLLDAMLARIQNDLFDLGADLCSPDMGKGPGGERLAIVDAQTGRLEREIDMLNAELTPLRSFVLPGGTPAAAHLHLARTVCRRAERLMIALADVPGETVSTAARAYTNRLSDLLFVASRYCNHKGAGDVLWIPGQNR